MSMASDPQTPWAQERRKVSVPSMIPLDVIQRIEQPVGGFGFHRILAPVGLCVLLGIEALYLKCDFHLYASRVIESSGH